MDSNNRYKKLNTIANGINAVSKIQEVISSSPGNNPKTTVREDKKTTLIDILHIIAEYSPDRSGNLLSDILNRSEQYCDSYKNVKLHLNSTRNQRVNRQNFINTLSVIKPLLDNRNKVMINKVLRIYEILFS